MNYPIYLSKIVAPGRELPESVQAQVEAFIADYREYQLGTVATALREAVSQEGGLRHYTSWVPQPALLDILRHYRPVREDWAADAALLLTQWAGIADEHHPSRDPQLLVSSAYVLSTARWAQRVEGMSESDYQTLRNAYQSIHGLNDPLFRHYGALLLMALDRHMGRLSETEASERVRRLTTDLRPLILPGEDALPARSRDVWIQIAIDAHDLLSIDERTAMGRQLFDDLAAAGYYSERLFERTLIGLAVEERRPDALAMVEQALRLLESGPDGPAESQRPALIEGLRTRRQGLRESLGLLDETVAPWTSVRTLIEVEGAEEGVRGIAAPVVEGRTAYAIGMSWSEDQGWVTLTLLSFDLDTGEPGTLGTYAIENLPVPRPFNAASPDELTLYSVIERSTTDGSDFVRGACVADGQCYVATMGHGILAFPLDGGPPRRIDESAGLPSDYVHALAHHDGRLYAWAGKPRTAAYLVRLDLDGGAPAIIASSRRTVRRTPLDNTGPVQCDLMFADAPRGRIIFRLTHSNSGENLGLWEVGLESDEIRQLWKTHLFLKSGTTARYTGESYVLVRDGADLHRFDLETDEVRRIYHKVTDTPWTFAPFAIVRGDLWVGIPFGRIDLETGRSEQFPPLRAGRFQPGCYVRRLGENELLIGDPSALWLVTLPAENAEPPEPQTQTPRP